MTTNIQAPIARVPIGHVTIKGQSYDVPMDQEWLRFLTEQLERLIASAGTVTNAANLTDRAVILGAGVNAIRAGPSPTTAGFVLTDNGPGVDPSFQAATGGMTNPMTTAGDIIVGGVAGAPARYGATTDGFVLTLAGGTPAWSAASSGGITLGQVEALLILPLQL